MVAMLTLIVPGLLLPHQALADLTQSLPLPGLSTLLGRARLQRQPPATSSSLLATAAALTEPLAAAALRMDHAGDAQWLCLDPVHLRFEERTMIVDNPQSLALNAGEAEQFATSLAPTFAELGEFSIVSPLCWNLRLTSPSPYFPPLSDAILRRAEPLSLDAGFAPWRRALNEAQMVLHTHPINKAREAARKPVVNSLWPWGGGRLVTSNGQCTQTAIWSNDPVARGIASHAGLVGAAMPESLPASISGTVLAAFDDLDLPARSGDGMAWCDAIARLDAGWVVPALSAIKAGKLDELNLIAPGVGENVMLRMGRRDLWKFWRSPRALSSLVAVSPSPTLKP